MATTVTSNDSLQLKSSSLGMEFYHIRWTPLSVNIFITHVHWLCNECYANDGI